MSTATDLKTKTKLKTPSMFKVVLHNDDFTPMDFVTSILVHIFHKSLSEAQELMLTVHHKGKANVALYTKEIATTKVRQVLRLAEAGGHPLLATAEEA
jgi:ATP-dependent Clp protease adaptor protein ClpS